MNISIPKTSIDPAIPTKNIDRPWTTRANDSNPLETQARKFVSQFFFGTLFKQMRSSSMGTDLFEGGSGGKSFQAMLDQHLSENMSNTPAGRKIAESLVQSLSAKKLDSGLPNSLEEARKVKSKKHAASSLKKQPETAGTPTLDMKG